MMAEWERLWCRVDNQEGGLEAATLERVRNSSLVESRCADALPGQSHLPMLRVCLRTRGRGASMVGTKHKRKPVWTTIECECRNE